MSHNNPRRKPLGTTRGGQFTFGTHTETDVELAGEKEPGGSPATVLHKKHSGRFSDDELIGLDAAGWTSADIDEAFDVHGATGEEIRAVGTPGLMRGCVEGGVGADGWYAVARNAATKIGGAEMAIMSIARIKRDRLSKRGNTPAPLTQEPVTPPDRTDMNAREFSDWVNDVMHDLTLHTFPDGGEAYGGYTPGDSVRFAGVDFGTGRVSGQVTSNGYFYGYWDDSNDPVDDLTAQAMVQSAAARSEALAVVGQVRTACKLDDDDDDDDDTTTRQYA